MAEGRTYHKDRQPTTLSLHTMLPSRAETMIYTPTAVRTSARATDDAT